MYASDGWASVEKIIKNDIKKSIMICEEESQAPEAPESPEAPEAPKAPEATEGSVARRTAERAPRPRGPGGPGGILNYFLCNVLFRNIYNFIISYYFQFFTYLLFFLFFNFSIKLYKTNNNYN
jgi:hypothetical protein